MFASKLPIPPNHSSFFATECGNRRARFANFTFVQLNAMGTTQKYVASLNDPRLAFTQAVPKQNYSYVTGFASVRHFTICHFEMREIRSGMGALNLLPNASLFEEQ